MLRFHSARSRVSRGHRDDHKKRPAAVTVELAVFRAEVKTQSHTGNKTSPVVRAREMFFALGLELPRKTMRNALGVKDWDEEEEGKSLRQRTQPRGKVVAGGGGGICKFCSPSLSPDLPSSPHLYSFTSLLLFLLLLFLPLFFHFGDRLLLTIPGWPKVYGLHVSAS